MYLQEDTRRRLASRTDVAHRGFSTEAAIRRAGSAITCEFHPPKTFRADAGHLSSRHRSRTTNISLDRLAELQEHIMNSRIIRSTLSTTRSVIRAKVAAPAYSTTCVRAIASSSKLVRPTCSISALSSRTRAFSSTGIRFGAGESESS